MSAAPTLLILAAGMGSRYGGFKQIEPLGPGGEIILDYSIFDAIRAGFGRIVIVTVPELEQPMRDHLRRTLGEELELVFVFQRLSDLPPGFVLPPDRTKPWGTAHAIRAARHELKGSFAMINADDFYGATSYQILHDSLVQAPAAHYCLVGFELAKTLSAHGTVSRGICRVDPNGDLLDVQEHTKIERDGGGAAWSIDGSGTRTQLPGDAVTSMNMFGFDLSLVPALENGFIEFLQTQGTNLKAEFYIPTLVDALIKSGTARCKVLHSAEQWFGVTYQEDRAEAASQIRALVAQGVYPGSLRIGKPRGT